MEEGAFGGAVAKAQAVLTTCARKGLGVKWRPGLKQNNRELKQEIYLGVIQEACIVGFNQNAIPFWFPFGSRTYGLFSRGCHMTLGAGMKVEVSIGLNQLVEPLPDIGQQGCGCSNRFD